MIGTYYDCGTYWLCCYNTKIYLKIDSGTLNTSTDYTYPYIWSFLSPTDINNVPEYIKSKIKEHISDPLFELEVQRLLKGKS